MKKISILILGIIIYCVPGANAQYRSVFQAGTEGYLDFDLKYGGLTNSYTQVPIETAYSSPVNVYNGQISFSKSKSLGFEGKFAIFFNSKKNWGITAGLQYMYQSGQLNIDTIHVEYSTVDSKNRKFRQMLSGHPISEALTANNVSIPLMLHYQVKHSPRIFYSIDAGLLYNISLNYNYNANATFDYEAVYKFDTKTNAFVYDNTPLLEGNGVIPMTVAQYYATNPGGTDVTGYLNALSKKWGATLGINQPITKKTGTVNYRIGGIGYALQPSLNYQISDLLFLKVGIYYMYQPFQNNAGTAGNEISAKIGSYNGLLNTTSTMNSSSFGLDIGIKYIIRERNEEDESFVTH